LRRAQARSQGTTPACTGNSNAAFGNDRESLQLFEEGDPDSFAARQSRGRQ